MPHGVRKAGSRWAIVRTDTGRVAGHSTSKRKARISAAIRDRADRRGSPMRRGA